MKIGERVTFRDPPPGWLEQGTIVAVSPDWKTSAPAGLEEAILEFKAALPGWWYSVCECQVSCDASCAPTAESPHAVWAREDRRFDDGFHADLEQPSTLADALRDVLRQALAAIATHDATHL